VKKVQEIELTSSLESIVEHLLPRSHLNGPQQLLLDLRLSVEQRKKSSEVFPDELRLVLSSGVERAERESSDGLREREEKIRSVLKGPDEGNLEE